VAQKQTLPQGLPSIENYNDRMFVHLRLHTEFSVVDGTTRIDDVIKMAAKDGQPALAITDLNNLFGAIKFYEGGRGKGVKPVIGAEIILEGLVATPQPSPASSCWCKTTGLPEHLRADCPRFHAERGARSTGRYQDGRGSKSCMKA